MFEGFCNELTECIEARYTELEEGIRLIYDQAEYKTGVPAETYVAGTTTSSERSLQRPRTRRGNYLKIWYKWAQWRTSLVQLLLRPNEINRNIETSIVNTFIYHRLEKGISGSILRELCCFIRFDTALKLGWSAPRTSWNKILSQVVR